ncbi:hypothetical protein PEDI_19040 [Persicobacter diffluens]|uniref:Uncharacterized protein n=1 Tax=Persicobacter diffluens TaxID=981 RepID=A0AAN4VZ33_9BACT|nr:hypothetical protein PEDI_19040 [Persicobacter diffluens]
MKQNQTHVTFSSFTTKKHKELHFLDLKNTDSTYTKTEKQEKSYSKRKPS